MSLKHGGATKEAMLNLEECDRKLVKITLGMMLWECFSSARLGHCSDFQSVWLVTLRPVKELHLLMIIILLLHYLEPAEALG